MPRSTGRCETSCSSRGAPPCCVIPTTQPPRSAPPVALGAPSRRLKRLLEEPSPIRSWHERHDPIIGYQEHARDSAGDENSKPLRRIGKRNLERQPAKREQRQLDVETVEDEMPSLTESCVLSDSFEVLLR